MSVPGTFPVATPKVTIAQVSADIADISKRVKSLHTSISNFPETGGSVVAAMSIHTIATELAAALSISTTDIKNNGSVSTTDATPILNSLQAIKPTVIDALEKATAKRPVLNQLPANLSTLAKQDLISLNQNTNAFEAALIAVAPTELKTFATSMKTSVDAAFAKAIASLANVTV